MLEIVPVVAFPPLTPLTDHDTALLKVPVPLTVAEYCWVACVSKSADEGEIVTDVMVEPVPELLLLPPQPVSRAIKATSEPRETQPRMASPKGDRSLFEQ